MRKSIVLMIVVLVFCSPMINSACAGQIQAKELSQTEADDMTNLQTDSAALLKSIEAGGEDGWLIVFAVIGVLVCVAAAAA